MIQVFRFFSGFKMVTSHLTYHSLLQKHSMVTMQIPIYINMLIPLGIHLVISKFLHNFMHATNDREQTVGLSSHTHTHTHHSWLVQVSRSETRFQSSRMSLTACLFKTYWDNLLPFTGQYIHSTIENISTLTNFSRLTYIHSEQVYHCPLIMFGWILYLVHHLKAVL